MRTARWSVVAAMLALLCLPVSVSHADDGDNPTPSASETSSADDGNLKPRLELSDDSKDSEDSVDSEDSKDESDSGDSSESDSDSDNSEKAIDPDATREALESQYENPADVAMPPKLLVPLLPGQELRGVPTLQNFAVVRLHHNYSDGRPDRHLEPGLSASKDMGAQLSAIPVDINTARISYKTPAQEFFDGATVGLVGLGSSAIVLGAIVFFRARLKEPADSN